jgi:hypothetical protein
MAKACLAERALIMGLMAHDRLAERALIMGLMARVRSPCCRAAWRSGP